MEGALFVKKLKKEEIDNETIGYSKKTFFYADGYIRKLEKYNLPIEVVEDTFSTCYNVYSDIRYRMYRKNKNSQKLVEEVMDNLSDHNFSSLNLYAQPKSVQKTGIIHILANDGKRDVFWGEVDINE